MTRRHVYGPVPSRRYGLSLGIDVLPHKVCSYDCVYCQCGPTTVRTLERATFFPVERVLLDVEEALSRGPMPEILTLAGSGEPTLYLALPQLLKGLHALADRPVLVLTNGSLLHLPQVRLDLAEADLVVPSLDAGDPETFRRVDGPHPDVDFYRMVEGIRCLVREHPGRVRLEVMLVKGVNDHPASLQAIAGLVRDLGVEGVDLNVPARPAPGRRVEAPEPSVLALATELWGPTTRVTDLVRRRAAPAGSGDVEAAILDLVSRRPSALRDMEDALGFDGPTLVGVLEALVARGRLRRVTQEGREHYLPGQDPSRAPA